MSIPISEVPLDREGRLSYILIGGWVKETFYLDDMKLVAQEVEIHPTAVEEVTEATAVPLDYSLAQNYPNPFNAGTTIAFELPSSAKVSLSVYNLAGQKVKTLVTGVKEPGRYLVSWDGKDEVGRDVTSGIYLYRLRTGEFMGVRRMVLLC